MSPSPYVDDVANPDPVAFGRTVADFELGEPLGRTVEILRIDQEGIGWWGSLSHKLPSE